MNLNWEQIARELLALILKSPIALITIGVSACCGYGISFVIFDYRKAVARKSHRGFHVAVGLGYAAVIFSIVNFDILSRTLTLDQITERMPLTLLVSFMVAFVIMIGGSAWRERFAPYYSPTSRNADGRRNRGGGANAG